MVLCGVILLMVGAGDVLRTALAGRSGKVRRALILSLFGAVLLSVLFWWTGLPLWAVFLTVLPAVLWFLAVPVPPGEGAPHAVGKLLLFFLSVAAVTFLAEGQSAVAAAGSAQVLRGFTAEALLVALGILLFHLVSANALVRVALDAESPPPSGADDALVVKKPHLKGGRWIGPLERVALTGLLVAGAYPVAAGLIAAKGIVRFPEMHEDRAQGNKAEYFLVGSFVSWTAAVVAAGLLRLVL